MSQKTEQTEQKLGPAIDLIEIVMFGIARFRFWLVPFALVGLGWGLWQAVITPHRYVSSAKLWVEWKGRENLSVESLVMGKQRSGNTGGRGGFGMEEELQLIKTPEYYERIAREVGPKRLTEPIDPFRFDTPSTPKWVRWQHQLQDWWFNEGRRKNPESQGSGPDMDTAGGIVVARGMIMRGLRLQKRAPNILMISYSTTSPELAQDVVAAAVKVTIERHREVFANRYKPEFVAAQLEEAHEDGSVASEEYYKHQKDCGFYDLTAQRQALLNDRNKIENLLSQGAIRLEEIGRDKQLLEEELLETPEEIVQLVDAKEGPNPAWQTYSSRVQEFSKELANLGLKYKEGSTFYKQQEEVINEKMAQAEKLRNETPMIVQISDAYEKTVDNPEFKRVTRDLRRIDAEKDKILLAEVKHNERLDAIDAQMDALTACVPRHSAMQNEITKANSRARQFQNAIDQREAIELLDTDEELSNMWVMIPAAYMPHALSPKREKTVLMGLAYGVAAGVGFGILRQLLDRKLRYPVSVEKTLGVPVLGVVPEQKVWKKMGKKLIRESVKTQPRQAAAGVT
jgi:uncharacterized protein involved in exopolysaccharide biosynthesis